MSSTYRKAVRNLVGWPPDHSTSRPIASSAFQDWSRGPSGNRFHEFEFTAKSMGDTGATRESYDSKSSTMISTSAKAGKETRVNPMTLPLVNRTAVWFEKSG